MRPEGVEIELDDNVLRLLRLLCWQAGIPVGSQEGLYIDAAVATIERLHVSVNAVWHELRCKNAAPKAARSA